jgi:hypothetical protein
MKKRSEQRAQKVLVKKRVVAPMNCWMALGSTENVACNSVQRCEVSCPGNGTTLTGHTGGHGNRLKIWEGKSVICCDLKDCSMLLASILD